MSRHHCQHRQWLLPRTNGYGCFFTGLTIPGKPGRPNKTLAQSGSTITNGREPRSCVGRVFNRKLGSFTDNTKNVAACKRPFLKSKTRPRFCPVSWSLSMAQFYALGSRMLVYAMQLHAALQNCLTESWKLDIKTFRFSPISIRSTWPVLLSFISQQ